MTWKSRLPFIPKWKYKSNLIKLYSQVQVESLRQEVMEKQSLLSEAGEAIEQLESKMKLQEDLNKKVKECSAQ